MCQRNKPSETVYVLKLSHDIGIILVAKDFILSGSLWAGKEVAISRYITTVQQMHNNNGD